MTDPRPRPIYLDYAATTPLDPRVLAKMMPYFTEIFGNPSSVEHAYGEEARAAVEVARGEVATLLGVAPSRIVFTATATEAINLGIQGFVRQLADKRKARILVSPVEHSAVLATCRGLEERGEVSVRYLRVDGLGRLDLDHLETECRDGVDLVCVQAANNEIGNIYPIAEVATIAQRYGGLLFSDLTQAAGKIPLALDAMGVAMAACSAHKIYGPKGAGALVAPASTRLASVLFGGAPERGIRPGTVNVPGVVGIGEACRLRRLEMLLDEPQVRDRRDALEMQILATITHSEVLGDRAMRLAGISGVILGAVPAEAVLAHCRTLMAISTGAACTRGALGDSHVVRAVGVKGEAAASFVRLSMGKFTTHDEVVSVAASLASSVGVVRGRLAC